MSYKFEAEPKVVQSRAKYRPTGSQANGNSEYLGSSSTIVKDGRVQPLTPAQQEAEYVRIEKERIKIENMHEKILNFKKSKKKVSPYDIKPAANPKVNVNLTFFLTDSTDTKPPQTHIDVQTDVFKEKPKSPKYVPKKTGRDVSTQIEDNELFSFDREVTPIIDVIVTKTLEQSIVEIEEEDEISRIKKFKGEYWKRRQEDENKWRSILQKELDAISSKDKKVEEYRIKEEKKIRVLRKLQTYQIAKNYLRDVGFNALTHLYNNGLYQNNQSEELINKIPGFFVDGVIQTLTQRHKVRDVLASTFDHIEGELTVLRQNADTRFKRKQDKRNLKRINNSKDERLVRFAYIDNTTPSTYFVRFMPKLQEPDLTAYFDDYRNRVNQLRDKFQNSELSQEEYNNVYATDFPELQQQNNLRIALNDLQVLTFSLANNMYYPDPPRDGSFDISVSTFNKEGSFLYQVDRTNKRNNSKSIKFLPNLRDNKAKISDDFGFKINLGRLEPEVAHLLLTVDIRNLDQSIAIFNDFLQFSRFRVADYATNQTIEATEIFPNFKLEELKDAGADSELGGKILCYYLTKVPELGWTIESVSAFKNVLTENAATFNNGVVERFLKVCMDEEFREFGDNPDFTTSLKESSKESFDKSRSKEKTSPAPSKVVDSKKDKGKEEKEKEKEEDEVSYGVKFTTRTYGPLHLKADDRLDVIQNKIDELLEKENPLLHKSFEYGYEICVNDTELVRSTQVRKIGAVTTFTVRRKPKPVEEIIVQNTEEGEQEQDEGSVTDE